MVTGAASARASGDGVAAHHGADADVSRFTDLELIKGGFRDLVAAPAAAQEQENAGRSGMGIPLFYRSNLDHFPERLSINDFLTAEMSGSAYPVERFLDNA